MPVTFEPVPEGQEMKLALDMEKEGIHQEGWHIYAPTWPAEVLLHLIKYCTSQLLILVRGMWLVAYANFL